MTITTLAAVEAAACLSRQGVVAGSTFRGVFRFVVVASAVVLAGCNGCPGSLTNTQVDPVRFSTSPLRFPDTAVGAETVLQLALTNPSRVRQTVTLSVDAPFFVAGSYEVPPGATESLSLTFRPSVAGEASAVLHVDEGGVPLSGLGLPPPMCAGTACRIGRFDAAIMQCTTDLAPDGVGCTDGCVEAGQCSNGECIGSSALCDDADVCTVDACGDEGCIHVPRECPGANDPCRVPSCNSQDGCTTREADDGTVCGAESCIAAEVRVCISGQCVARLRPETALCSKTWVPLVIPATWDAKLAWDEVNRRIITSVGGMTWSWDGTRWSQQFPPSTLPSGAYEVAVDSARKRVVAWSGSDTYEWDGSTWLHRASEPEPRTAPALAYDAKRRRTVRFGGDGLNGHGNDTWEWDGTRWDRRTPIHVPPGRAYASMAWDPVREKVVLVGGADSSFAKLSDTWEWDGNDWRLVPVNTPPTARFGATLTWNPERLSLMFIGGSFATATRDVWALNGSTWAKLNDDDLAATGHGAEWDLVHEKLIVFSLGGTWEWDGSRFISRKALAPNPKQAAAIAFDEVHREIVSYSGMAVPIYYLEPLDELWLKSAAGWNARGVLPRPLPRHNAGMAWDAVHQRVVMFGGSSIFGSPMGPVGQLFGETWEWDGAAWTQRTPTTAPQAGGVLSTTWDSSSQRVVMLTNQDGVWSWDGNDWSRLADASSLSSFDSAIAFDRTSLKLLMVTGQNTYELATDGGWSTIASASLPANITRSELVWDSQSNRVLLQAFRGTFEWNGVTWVDLRPRVKPLSEPEAMVFDGNLNRVTLFTTNDEWVYLP